MSQSLSSTCAAKIADFAENIFGEPMLEVHRGVKDSARAVYGSKNSSRTPEQIAKIRDILQRAAKEIDEA